MTSLAVKVGAVALVQLALVGVAVAPRLSARLTGEEYRLRVAPVDPIDPFRGAYVDLTYPDLHLADTSSDGANNGANDGASDGDPGDGTVYVTLKEDGGVWKASSYGRDRPSGAAYLTCNDHGFQVHCGIESLFLPQDEAAAMQETVGDGAVAVIKIDGRGHAALVRVEAG